MDYLELKEEKLLLRKSIVAKLKILFNKFWVSEEFEVSMFGSTLTKLAIDESDMDVSILFNNYLPANSFVQQKIPKVCQKNNSIDSNETNSIGCEEVISLEESSSNGDDEPNKDLKNAMKKFFVR